MPLRKLGKLSPKLNKKTLRFSKYLLDDAPPLPPAKAYWEYKVDDWKMFANDKYGDCTCAAIAHMLMSWTAHTGKIVVPTEAEVLAVYSAVSGFDPVTGANDSGAFITDVLEHWKQTGIAGHKIDSWAKVDHTNPERLKQAIYLFGGVILGVQFPNAAMDQTDAGQAWSILENDGGNGGGHCIPNFGYGSRGTTGVTWAKRQPMTWPWLCGKYGDEAYVVVSLDWLDQGGLTPSHLDLDALRRDSSLV